MNELIYLLYCETVTKKGNAVMRLAKLAPAPMTTNSAGAQQIRVDEDAKREIRLVALSSNKIRLNLL